MNERIGWYSVEVYFLLAHLLIRYTPEIFTYMYICKYAYVSMYVWMHIAFDANHFGGV